MNRNQIAKILNSPLAIDYAGLESLIAAAELRTGDLLSQVKDPSRIESIAVIPITGALSHRSQGSIYSWLFGDTASYEGIRAQFRAAIEDASADAIVFEIDSPGGEAAGCFDLVDEIYQARGTKPIIAIANETALSGAYAIASAADKVYLSRTAQVGSIGVIAIHIDQSAYDQEKGIKITPIFAGEHKNDFSPHFPLSKEAYAEGKKEVDQIYNLFSQTVARNRDLSEKTIKETEAGKYTGVDAVNIGLADGVSSFDQSIKRFLEGEYNMSLHAEIKALISGKTDEEVNTAMKSLGFNPKGAMKPLDLDKLKAEAVAEVREILGLCELSGVSDLPFVKSLITDGVSVKDAQAKILEAKADESDNQEIFSTVSALSTGTVNPLIADAKRRAGKEV